MPIGFILTKKEFLAEPKLLGFYPSVESVNEAIYRDYDAGFDYLHEYDTTTNIVEFSMPVEESWIPIDFVTIVPIDGVTAGFTFEDYKHMEYTIYLAGSEEMEGAACSTRFS